MFVDTRTVSNPSARQVLQILDQGAYHASTGEEVSLRAAQEAAVRGTRSYAPEELARLCTADAKTGPGTTLELIDATTQVAARQLSDEGPIVLLNFASARNPGGGFLGGARAQEEDLCRCSGLYPALLTQPEYYQTNRAQRSLLYSDHLIYSPAVPFFRVGSNKPLLPEPFLASVITAPAPNGGAIQQSQPERAPEIGPTFLRRWANVLAAAEDQGHQTVVLGAWGCGAFHNDATLAATTARDVIRSPRFAGSFRRIVFAIPSAGKRSTANQRTFADVLGL